MRLKRLKRVKNGFFGATLRYSWRRYSVTPALTNKNETCESAQQYCECRGVNRFLYTVKVAEILAFEGKTWYEFGKTARFGRVLSGFFVHN